MSCGVTRHCVAPAAPTGLDGLQVGLLDKNIKRSFVCEELPDSRRTVSLYCTWLQYSGTLNTTDMARIVQTYRKYWPTDAALKGKIVLEDLMLCSFSFKELVEPWDISTDRKWGGK